MNEKILHDLKDIARVAGLLRASLMGSSHYLDMLIAQLDKLHKDIDENVK